MSDNSYDSIHAEIYDTSLSHVSAGHLVGPVLIIGSGLLGASIALALTSKGIDVYLADRSSTAVEIAVGLGAGHPHSEMIHDPELVVVATPPEKTADVCIDALKTYQNSTVVDIASVKEVVLKQVEEAFYSENFAQESRLEKSYISRFVGTHPMSGGEKAGPINAQEELFKNKPWIIVPLVKNGHLISGETAIRAAESLAIDCGATLVSLEPNEHDQAMALISHGPQVIASLFASRLQDASATTLSLAGNGVKDLTRIAGSDPDLWVQILSHNSFELKKVLEAVAEDLARLLNTLQNTSAPSAKRDMAHLFQEGNSGYGRLPGKHGSVPQSFTQLNVVVQDTPGQLSSLFVDIETFGTNIEDMRMDHSPGKQSGVVEISVLPSQADALVEYLRDDHTGSTAWSVVY